MLGGDPFGMTVAGLRLSRIANGVAELHGETARKMWAHVEEAAPIVAVTNGVHPPTWQDQRIRVAYAQDTLWETHQQLKRELSDSPTHRQPVHIDGWSLLRPRARPTSAASDRQHPKSSSRCSPSTAAVVLGQGTPRERRQGHRREPGARLAALPGTVLRENYTESRPPATRAATLRTPAPRSRLGHLGHDGGMTRAPPERARGWWPDGCEPASTEADRRRLRGLDRNPTAQDSHDRASLSAPSHRGAARTPTRALTAMMRARSVSIWKFSARMLEDYYVRLYREPASERAVSAA